MKRWQRIEEAARWFLISRDQILYNEEQRQEHIRWLNASIKNVAAAIAVQMIHAQIVRRIFARNTLPAKTAKAPSVLGAVPMHPVISRRRLVAAFGAMSTVTVVGMFTDGAFSRFRSTREDVIASDHVLRVPLGAGVMHAARNSIFSLRPATRARTVHLHSGQAAFHLQPSTQLSTEIVTSIARVVADAAGLAVLMHDSLLEVTVAEGVAHVFPIASHIPQYVLRAGQQLRLRQDAATPPATMRVDAERELGWIQGDLYVDGGEKFGDIAATFNRFNELQIVPSPEVARLPVPAHQYPLSDPKGYVALLAQERMLVVRQEGKRILISKAEEGQEIP